MHESQGGAATGQSLARAPDDKKAPNSTHPIRKSEAACWTDCVPRTQHNALFLDRDFGSTSLGPLKTWGPSLRAYATMMFADSRAASIYWGPERILFYNEAFSVLYEGVHPFAMGRGFAEVFPELVKAVNPLLDAASSSGQTANVDNMLTHVRRNGYLEETYFIGQYTPLRGDSGEIEGFYNPVIESTAQVLHERRRRVVDQVISIVPLSVDRTLSSFIEILGTNPSDITAAILYSFDDLAPSGSDNLQLRGSIGIPAGHPCALQEACLDTSQIGLVPHFRQVRSTGRPLVLSLTHDSLPAERELFSGIDWSGYGEQSETVVIYHLAVGDETLGFYLQGTNSRRKYDEATERSISDVVTQLEVKWASSVARERAHLREQALERRTTESENRLRKMAQNAPVGMYQIGTDQNIKWANDQFYEITGHDRSKPSMAEFRDVLAPEERDKERILMERLGNGAARATREIRLEREWNPPGEKRDKEVPSVWSAWVLAVTFPIVEDREVVMMLGYVVDISRQKWGEGMKTQHAKKAEEARQRQEEFLDVTSHELRNPLGAITQLADGIAKSGDLRSDARPEAWQETARENAAAAETILQCATHQKRVIDDILILSRLDSQMLSITPTVARPGRVVENSIKMLEGLVSEKTIQVSTVRGKDAYEYLDLECIWVDTSRLTQVLINLLNNAIKFTASRPVREISVKFGMQGSRPPYLETRFGNLQWLPHTESEQTDVDVVDMCDADQRVFAYFLVSDTGPGLTKEESERMFKRFSQANTKTHVQYGGNGLGLYICRKIVEKQGGRVGVASLHGEGAAFAFYLETKAAPIDDSEEPPEAGSNVPASLINGREVFHVLLVEDNKINQKVLVKQLEKAKCKVSVANHGVEALEILEANGRWRRDEPEPQSTEPPIEVVLMDIEMPVMDGHECTKEIRRIEAERKLVKRLPIIAVTANARQEQGNRLISIGVDSLLTKPFTVGDLLSRIRESVT